MNLLSIFAAIPSIVVAVEAAAPTPGSGVDKAAAVLAAVAPMIPDDVAPTVVPQIKNYVSMLVTVYHARDLFKKA